MAAPDLHSPEPTEIRCRGGLLGVARDGLLEVKCRHWACTREGNVTFHLLDVFTGSVVETYSYQDPNKGAK